MTFDVVFLLSLILLMLFAIVVLILAYPGPVDGKRRARIK